MKNKKMFIVLSIVALSAPLAHATIEENFKQAVKQINTKLAQDPEAKELFQAIAAKTETFKQPKDLPWEKFRELQKQWQKEIEELPAIAQLATKIKENFDERTLQSIKEIKQLNEISKKQRAELDALTETPKYKKIEAFMKQFHEDQKKIREKSEYKVLYNRAEDRRASNRFIDGLLKGLATSANISSIPHIYFVGEELRETLGLK